MADDQGGTRKLEAELRALREENARLRRANAELSAIARRAIAAYYAPHMAPPALVQLLSEQLARCEK